MEIRQLQIFVCAARHGSFSKAAEELYVSQPTVSTSVAALEKAIGAQLFIRGAKGVLLTKAGVDFLPYANNILSHLNQALDAHKNAGQGYTGEITIASSTIPAQHLLPELIASFQKEHPRVTFRVSQTDSRGVERELRGFGFDFGMTGTVPDEGRFVFHPFYDDELVLAVPADTPDSAESIRERLADFLSANAFIMRGEGSGTRAEVEALLAKSGVKLRSLRVPAYFSDTHGVLLAVSRSMGVSLVSKTAAVIYESLGRIRIIELDGRMFSRKIYLLHNREIWLSPVMRAFSDHVRGYYG